MSNFWSLLYVSLSLNKWNGATMQKSPRCQLSLTSYCFGKEFVCTTNVENWTIYKGRTKIYVKLTVVKNSHLNVFDSNSSFAWNACLKIHCNCGSAFVLMLHYYLYIPNYIKTTKSIIKIIRQSFTGLVWPIDANLWYYCILITHWQSQN